MKSPEQMGKPTEEPKERPIPPESYDEAKWIELKRSGLLPFAINQGKKMGVPQEEIDRFAEDFIARETKNKNYDLVYKLRKNMGIGTEEDIRIAGEQLYKFFLKNGQSDSIVDLAEEVYGKDSEEWRHANEMNKAKKEEKDENEDEEQELKADIYRDATFADLFEAIDAIEEDVGLGELHFEEELWDNFNSEVAEKILAFRDVQEKEAANTKVLDFFKKYGYSQNDITVFLPIEFKRKQNKK